MKMVIFDATIKAQFLKELDIIERGGREITVLAVHRDDNRRDVGIAFQNLEGGIQGAAIPFDVDVLLGTELDVPDDLFD